MKTIPIGGSMPHGLPYRLANRFRLDPGWVKYGGFAIVCRGWDEERDDALCLVKILREYPDESIDIWEKRRELFYLESELLEKLRGYRRRIPYLIAPVEEEGGHLYLVEEFVEGKTLDAETKSGRFSAHEVREMLEQLLDVLAFVHSQGVIHRDIKPDNILRRRDGVLVLIDFGACKEWRGRTEVGTALDSGGFTPPELRLGGVADFSSDLYSLGMTAIFLLTGSLPFSGWEEGIVDEQLLEVLKRMIAPRGERYESAREALDALRGERRVRQGGSIPKSSGGSLGTVILALAVFGVGWLAASHFVESNMERSVDPVRDAPSSPDRSPNVSSPLVLPPIRSKEAPKKRRTSVVSTPAPSRSPDVSILQPESAPIQPATPTESPLATPEPTPTRPVPSQDSEKPTSTSKSEASPEPSQPGDEEPRRETPPEGEEDREAPVVVETVPPPEPEAPTPPVELLPSRAPSPDVTAPPSTSVESAPPKEGMAPDVRRPLFRRIRIKEHVRKVELGRFIRRIPRDEVVRPIGKELFSAPESPSSDDGAAGQGE